MSQQICSTLAFLFLTTISPNLLRRKSTSTPRTVKTLDMGNLLESFLEYFQPIKSRKLSAVR